MGKPLLVPLILALTLLPSCDQSTESSGTSSSATGGNTAVAEEDLARAFQLFATNYVAALRKAEKQTWATETGDGTTLKGTLLLRGEPEIDVRKTDSLISPYLGSLKTSMYIPSGRSDDKLLMGYPSPLELTFAYQQGKWVLKSALAKNISDEERFHKSCEIMTNRGPTMMAARARLEAAVAESQ